MTTRIETNIVTNKVEENSVLSEESVFSRRDSKCSQSLYIFIIKQISSNLHRKKHPFPEVLGRTFPTVKTQGSS